jgi:DNA polymerase-3 subunit beta
MAQTWFIHNSQALLQALSIYLPSDSVNAPRHAQSRTSVKFRSEREQLAEALGLASRIASGRVGALPALSGVRLQVKGDALHLTSTDNDMTLQASLPIGGDRDGICLISAKLLNDIVRSLPEGKITLEATSESLAVKSGRSQFTVPTYNALDFPNVAPSAGAPFIVPAGEFGEALRQVVRAASGDQMRIALTGVLLTGEEGSLRLVATDSYRLAVRDVTSIVIAASTKVLIPSRALAELQRLLSGATETAISLDDNSVTFDVGGTKLTSRILTNEYPNYKNLLGGTYPNAMTTGRDAMLDALRRARILAKDQGPVRLAMTANSLKLTAGTKDNDEFEEDLDGVYNGDDITIAFNSDYLAAGVDAIPTDDVIIKTIDPARPAVITAAGDKSSEYLYLLMPQRI